VAMNDHLQNLIQKYFEGTLTLKEDIELSELIADPKNRNAEQFLNDAWQSQLKSQIISSKSLKSILDKVHHSIRLNESIKLQRFNWVQIFQRVAAILIIPLLLSFLVFIRSQPGKSSINVAYAEIQCPLGVRTKFLLPDGSTGFLNSGSRLRYPVVFAQQRSVELIGEGFFDVVHNKEIPFHVKTRNLDIKVVGTIFNVIANEDEETEEIILQSGEVDISFKSGKQMAVLFPNEKLTINTKKQTFTKKHVIASQYTTWKEGRLVFRNENMKQVAVRLSRWYNANVIVEDSLLNNYTFHATFIDEPLDEVLKLISITSPITFREERRTSDKEGIYQKRKIVLQINKLKINQFR